MDRVGNRGAHSEIQAIKIGHPKNRGMGAGTKPFRCTGPLGSARTFHSRRRFANIRTLRFADGPDEVHKNALAKSEIGRQHRPPRRSIIHRGSK